jgi:hypothetical protein
MRTNTDVGGGRTAGRVTTEGHDFERRRHRESGIVARLRRSSSGGLLALVVILGTLCSATSAAAARPNIGFSDPAHYIGNWAGRAQECGGFLKPDFVTWTSYTAGSVGSHWLVRASKPSLCKQAKSVSKKLIHGILASDGATLSRTEMQVYAVSVGQEGRNDDPISKSHGVPRGWQCFALPSEWGENAWSLAEVAHVGAPEDGAFAAASGAAAGAGYCVTGAKSDSKGRWQGGDFFAWEPNVTDCSAFYTLSTFSDPDDPAEEQEYPSYENSDIWGSYTKVPCLGGAGVPT